MKKCRPGFEPDKSTADWMGKRVRNLPNSGGFDNEIGTVVAVEVRGIEYGWCRVLFDRPDLSQAYPDGMLTHSTEVEVIHDTAQGREPAGICSAKGGHQ